MAVVETLPRSSSLLRSFQFWNLHHPVVPLMGLILFAPLVEGGSTHFATMVIRLLILLALAVWCLQIYESGKLVPVQTNLWVPISLYLGLALVSTVNSPYQNQSVQWLMVLGGYAVAFYLLVETITVWNFATILMKLVLVIGIAEALWAWAEWWAFGMARPNGSFFNANFLAGYEAAIAVGALASLSYAPWRRLSVQHFRKQDYWIPVALCILVATISTVLLTGSRGAMLALLCGVIAVVSLRWGWKGCAIVSAIAMMVVFAPTAFRTRLVMEHAANPESYARWQMWMSGLREMADHPFGVGLGLYQYTYPQYAFPIEGEIARYGKVAFTPHNEYLQMGVELGVASVVVFLWGVATLYYGTLKQFSGRLSREQRIAVVSAIGGTVVILVQAAVDSPLHEPGLVLLLLVFTSLLVAHRWWNTRPSERCSGFLLPHPRLLMLGATVLMCLLTVQVVRVGMAYSAYELGSLRAGDNDQVTQYLGWAVTLDPGKALFHQALGAAQYQEYWRSGGPSKLQAAIEELHTAIRLNPLDGHLQAILGGVYAALIRKNLGSELGQSTAELERAAREAYVTASRLQPYTYSHRFEWARLLDDMGRHTEALAQYQVVLELEPNFLPARERLARMYLHQGNRNAAQQEFHEIIDRQRRLASHYYDPYAKPFLTVNVKALEEELGRKDGKT